LERNDMGQEKLPADPAKSTRQRANQPTGSGSAPGDSAAKAKSAKSASAPPSPQTSPKIAASAGNPELSGGAPALTAEDAALLDHHISFWQLPWVQSYMPWVTSFIVHAAIITLGLLLIKPISKLVTTEREQVIIPDSVLATDAQAGGIPNPGIGADPNRAAAQNTVEAPADAHGVTDKNSDLTSTLQGGGGGPDSTSGTVIGMGGSAGGGPGVGGPSGGGLAPWGIPGGGGGIGPKCNFLGSGGNANVIVFVCDASGSMVTKLDLLKQKLDQAIRGLQPVQAFNVVFFHGQGDDPANTFELFQSTVVMANPANKEKLYAWVDNISPRDSTYVIPALTRVFQMFPKVQLLYLLTDGAFEEEGGAKVTQAINSLNPSRSVHINTILLSDTEKEMKELDKDAIDTMTQIANQNGGNYSSVCAEDIN
jgi:hypothetical protein